MRVSGRVPSKGNGLGGNVDRVDRGEGRMQAGATQGHRCTFGGRVMAREGKCGQGAGTAGGKQLGMTGARCCQGGPWLTR